MTVAAPLRPVGATQAVPGRAVPPVGRARLRLRHVMTLASFLLAVVVPVALASVYLFTRAQDRYVSHVAFSVRSEHMGSALEMLGGVAELSGSSSSDTDILYNFIKSSELVSTLDRRLDLRALWSRPGTGAEVDPIFAYAAPGTIEDLTDYWGRMVKVYSDTGTGLIDVEAQAFAPEDAQRITRAIYEESSAMINRLSAIAREDRIRYARAELDTALERLKTARATITRFRNENQIVDPSASIQSQMGLLSSLQEQLAQMLIELDLLRQTTREEDPRIAQAQRRVSVIEARIAEERGKLGLGAGAAPAAGEAVFADIVGEYERLAVDQEFAEQSYKVALASYDTALAEAQRQSRYLAAHIQPTLPEAATEPQREKLIALVGVFALLLWGITILAAYALRDRR